jgi:DNA-binding GntR family transcriptional regulator
MSDEPALDFELSLRADGTRTLAGAIVKDLRRRILSGEIPDGTFLRQDMLATKYAISRIPVREALGQLAAEGLIVHIPHRGAMIPHLSADDVFDLYDTRAVLEPHLIRDAVSKMDATSLHMIKDALEACGEAIRTGRMENWGELNARFHYSLYEPVRRPHALAIVQGLLNKSDRYAKISLVIAGEASRAQAEHVELYELCVKGSADEAAVLLRNHIRNSGDSLVSVLRARQFQANTPAI